MQLLFKTAIRNCAALVGDSFRRLAREFPAKFGEWREFFKTRIRFFFKNYWRVSSLLVPPILHIGDLFSVFSSKIGYWQ